MRRLNVGCGPIAAVGWDNIDIVRPGDWRYFGETFDNAQCEIGTFVERDICAPLPDHMLSTYDRVEMHHVLSGFTWDQSATAVHNVWLALHSGGTFRLSDVDLRRLVQMWIGRHTDRLPTADRFKLEDERLCRMVFYNEWRRSIYTAATACKLLEDHGFTVRAGFCGESGLDTRPEESFYVEGVK